MLYNGNEVMNMDAKMIHTFYTIGLFVLAFVLYFEGFFHIEWEFKRGVKAVVFLAYLAIGIFFNLI